MPNKRYMISGGGTGGHIFPAIAIANKLKELNPTAEFLFVGAKDKMEMEKVPAAGYKIEGLWISGIQRKLTLDNLMFPFKLISSISKARKLIKKFNPDVVIGVGGFASGPTLKAAQQLGVPTLIQEQNSFPGITNKWLAGKVNKICVAYNGMDKFFPKEKLVLTGNPVRESVLQIEGKKEKAATHFNLKTDKKTLLIIGGSLGAKSVNEGIEKYLAEILKLDIQVVWQTGKLFVDRAKKLVADNNWQDQVYVSDFIYEMDLAYAQADWVVSRAGAIAVAELSLIGKPTILVPFPFAAEDHQTKNAEALSNHHAAVLLPDAQVQEKLYNEIKTLVDNPEACSDMASKMKELGLTNATDAIVKEIEKLN